MRERPKTSPVRPLEIRLLIVAAAAVGLSALSVFTGCQGAAGSAPAVAAPEVREHLREGILAIDRGDDATAEAELTESLKLAKPTDPLRGKARDALASLYARQAGINASDWVDTLLKRDRGIQAHMNEINDASRWIEHGDGLDDSSGAPAGTLAAYGGYLARALVSMRAFVEAYPEVPDLNDTQLASLDKAILTLQSGGSRSFQSVLGVVRMINSMRRVVSPPAGVQAGVIQIGPNSPVSVAPAFCSRSVDEIHARLSEVRKALVVIRVGLGRRFAAEDFGRAAYQLLGNPIMLQLDPIFASGAPAIRSARVLIAKICGNPEPTPDPTPSITNDN